MNNSRIPHVMELNRVKRAYTGGKLLDKWQGIENPTDGNMSEEFLSSTVEITNEDRKPQEGLSKTILPNGEIITLKDLISEDFENMLGIKYASKKDVCVSARAGDTTVRHVLQCHPDTEFANKYLNFPNGKAEAWYILDQREIEGQKPVLYAGFKKGVTKEKWTELYAKQDIEGMLGLMHCLPIQKGKVYFVPSGCPHCLGAGNVFLEIHEPCDYTFRVEKDYLPNRKFSDFECHYGLGDELLMDAFHYDTHTEEEMKKIVYLEETPMFRVGDTIASEVASYAQTGRFKIEKYVFNNGLEIPNFEGHRIAITVEGNCTFSANGYDVKAHQGRAVFLPYECDKLTLKAEAQKDTIVLVCYPPKAQFNPKDTFFNPIQVGILTKDSDKFLSNLENVFGMAPWRIAKYPPDETHPYMEYKGKEGNFKAKFCFYHLGNIELEIIQPLEGDNIWSDFLDKHGNSIHHIKFEVDEHKEVEDYLKSKGYHIIQQGAAVGLNTGKIWAFYNTFEDVGFDIEIMNRLKG